MKVPMLAVLLGLGLAGMDKVQAAEPEVAASTGAPTPKYFDFEDDQVEGAIQRPDGELINATRRATHESLIEIRRNFIPEIMKSLEDLE